MEEQQIIENNKIYETHGLKLVKINDIAISRFKLVGLYLIILAVTCIISFSIVYSGNSGYFKSDIQCSDVIVNNTCEQPIIPELKCEKCPACNVVCESTKCPEFPSEITLVTGETNG